jgi:HAD superfamily hydrolase (TIGR01509 family)
MIKGIFFDAADVFYNRSEQTSKYVLTLLRQCGYPTELTTEEQKQLKQANVRATEGRMTPDAYWDQVLLMHRVSASEERARLVEQINDYSNVVHAIPGGKEALAELKQRGFVLGIVTDTLYPIEVKMRWLDSVGVAEFIDVVACSSVLGAHKPEPAMYLNAVEQAHLTISESVFVGHDAGELEGARQAGLATVAVNYDLHAKADYYCKSLLDLLNVPIFQRTSA